MVKLMKKIYNRMAIFISSKSDSLFHYTYSRTDYMNGILGPKGFHNSKMTVLYAAGDAQIIKTSEFLENRIQIARGY